MKTLYIFLILLFSSYNLSAQSFYTLSGVDSYDPLVINKIPEAKKYTKDIQSLMLAASKELGIVTEGHSSRVLVFDIKKFSVGECIGIKVTLALGEYVQRKGSKEQVFAITYKDSQTITPEAVDLEDHLADSIEELLESFVLQHKEDNKDNSAAYALSHEEFAKVMHYETEYETALAKAKKENKPLMIFMTTTYCPWCRKLESQVLSKEKYHATIMQRYIPLMLNYDEKKFPEKFLKEKMTPTLYIVNAKSEKIEEKFVGFNNRDAFLHLLK
jgi:thiol-disulfide isomerase/thioredoxin